MCFHDVIATAPYARAPYTQLSIVIHNLHTVTFFTHHTSGTDTNLVMVDISHGNMHPAKATSSLESKEQSEVDGGGIHSTGDSMVNGEVHQTLLFNLLFLFNRESNICYPSILCHTCIITRYTDCSYISWTLYCCSCTIALFPGFLFFGLC